MIIHEAGALTLLNFLIHGQSSESLAQSGRLAAAVKQQKRSPLTVVIKINILAQARTANN
jgi:hypothetical protein